MSIKKHSFVQRMHGPFVDWWRWNCAVGLAGVEGDGTEEGRLAADQGPPLTHVFEQTARRHETDAGEIHACLYCNVDAGTNPHSSTNVVDDDNDDDNDNNDNSNSNSNGNGNKGRRGDGGSVSRPACVHARCVLDVSQFLINMCINQSAFVSARHLGIEALMQRVRRRGATTTRGTRACDTCMNDGAMEGPRTHDSEGQRFAGLASSRTSAWMACLIALYSALRGCAACFRSSSSASYLPLQPRGTRNTAQAGQSGCQGTHSRCCAQLQLRHSGASRCTQSVSVDGGSRAA